MAKRYQKDIKVVLPKSNPFRDIAVYGAGEEMIKALGGELPDKGKQPDIVPTKNNPHYMKKSNKKGQSPRSILSPEQKMAMEFGWGGALGSVLGAAAGSFIPVVGTGLGASIGGALGSAVEGSMDNKKQPNQQFQPQYQQALPQQMQFAKGGKLNKRGIPNRDISEQMPYQSQMQSYPNLEFGNGEQMLAGGGMIKRADGSYSQRGLWDNIRDNKGSDKKPTKEMLAQEAKIKAEYAYGGKLPKEILRARAEAHMSPEEANNYVAQYANGGQLEDVEFAKGGIYIKPSKRGTFTAAAKKHGKSVQGFASQVLANKENYSPAMVKKANFARNAAKWKHAEGGFLNEPAEGVIERRNKNRSREPQEYATFEENFKHMYAQGGRMGAMGPMDMSKIYYADGGEEKEGPYKTKEVKSTFEGPRNTFDIESTYVNDVDPNILAKQKEIAAKLALSRIMGSQGNTTLGLTGNVNYSNAQQPMGEEESNTMLRKNPNVTGNIGITGSYNRGNSSFTGGLGYDPISKTTTGNVGFRKQWAEGGMLNHYNGYKHEDGGIPIGPNAEVEGGETSMKMGMGGEKDSTYIFSHQLKVPGKNYSYADSSKKIDNKYNRRTNDKLSNESKRLELNKLMESQEQERAGLVNSAYQTIAAYGGPIRKYAVGGGTDPIGKTTSYYDFNDPFAGNTSNPTVLNSDNFKNAWAKNKLGLENYTPNDNVNEIKNRISNDLENAALEKEMSKIASSPRRVNAIKSSSINNPYTANNIQGMTAMTPRGIQNIPSGNTAPDTLQNIAAPDFNEQVDFNAPNRFGTGEQWAKGLGYGLQGASLLARQLQLSRNKLSPNKAFTMERQLLNADPQLREADISATIANRNIRDLGASTSSGGAMAGYLAAQAGRTRSKADIMADLQNRQAQIDMTTGQYNTMAGERAYDKDAADLAAQQTSQAQLFADMSKLGSGITRDYLLGQSQEGLMESAYNPYFKYKKQKGRNKYNTEYTG